MRNESLYPMELEHEGHNARFSNSISEWTSLQPPNLEGILLNGMLLITFVIEGPVKLHGPFGDIIQDEKPQSQ
jgi:hypothetical protein